MTMLIAGVLLWSIVHLMKSVAPGVRAGIRSKIGDGPHQGLVALLILSSVALMVFGWRSATPTFVYDAPLWGRHLNMLLMLIAIYLIVLAQGKSRVKQWIRHPMLTGMVIWATGHLLANGDSRSLVLFGGLGLWAIVSIITVSRNEGSWKKPVYLPPIGRDLLTIIASFVAYFALFYGHRWFAGVPVIS